MKKQFLLLMLVLFACIRLQAGNIVAAEYFWDNDPGVGLAISIPAFNPADQVTVSASIPTTGLTSGNHILYIRTKDESGHWSLSESRIVTIVAAVVTAEYFWDNDPGIGQGSGFNISPIGNTVNIGITISSAGLTSGTHLLYMRTKDNNGHWSLAEPRTVNIIAAILSAEYFWDTDPGVGNGVSLPAFDPVNFASVNATIPTTGLTSGSHQLYIRTKDNNGHWSLSEPRIVTILAAVVTAEYFWDTDPGVGNGVSLPAFDPVNLASVNATIPTTGLASGSHQLYIRTKDNNGNWSLSEPRTVSIIAAILSAEYFWDTDPGVGNATAIAAFNPANFANISAAIPAIGLTSGNHLLYVRTKDNNGHWSLSEPRTISIVAAIVGAEYFWDTDPGVGNATAIAAFDHANFANINATIPTIGLTSGNHLLYVRTKDNNGHWSLSEPRTITVESFSPYVDFENGDYYIKPGPGNELVLSGETLANFNYNTALPTHPIFNDGIYFPRIDHDGNNIWVRLQHIAADPNGTGTGYSVANTAASPFRPGTFGGWWGFLYQLEIYKDGNISGIPSYTLNGLYPTNVIVESNEILSPREWVSLKLDNPEASNWDLNSINYTGDNLNSNPGFSAVNIPYYNYSGFSANFSAVQKELYAIDRLFDENGNYAEFRVNAANVSQFKYGFESPDNIHYQGIRLYVGNPDIPAAPANDDCTNAVTLIPTADQSFNGTTGTLTSATASSFTDCDHKTTYDVWYKFTATAKYHRIVLKNADVPANMGFQLYGGNCSAFYTIACVLNSRDSTVYDATDLRVGETYYLKVYNRSSFVTPNSFDIGIVTPPLTINKGLNVLANASFETPAIAGQSQNMGNTITPWANNSGLNMAVIKEVSYNIIFGADTASSGMQYMDMLGFNDTLYQHFSIANTTTVFFSGHFANQASQYPPEPYQPWTGFCGILDENNIMVAKSDIMNFTNKLTDKAWYQLSGTAYDLPPGNYKYIAYVSNYSNFDDAFVQANFNCPLISQPPTSVTTDDADNVICDGTSITLTANGAVLASGASYAWYEGGCANGLSIGSGPTLTLIPSLGIHNYYVLVQEACGYTDCSAIGITVVPSSPVSISISTTANLNSLCENIPVTFNATTTNTSSIATYQWKINGQPVGSNQPFFTATTFATNDVITCSIVTFCDVELTSNSLTINSIIPSLPNTISITTATTTVCAGSYVVFNASAPNVGFNPVKYEWRKNGIVVQTYNLNFPSSTIFNTSYYDTYNIATNDVITCEVTSSTACTLPATAVSNAITMTVLPVNNTSVSIALTTGSNPDCSGDPLTFTATQSNGGATPTYEWHLITGYPSSNTVVGANSPTYTLQNPTHNDVVYCNMTGSIVCSSPAVASSNSITVKAPTVLAGYINCNSNCNGSPNMSTCGSATVEFYAISWNVINSFYYTNNSPSYQWKLNGNNVGTNSNTYSQTGFTDGDVITCAVSSTEPCASPASLDLSMTVSVYDVSNATFSIASGPTTLCAGTPAVFYAQPGNAGASPSYQWKLNGNDIAVSTYGYYELANPVAGDVVTCVMTTDPVCGLPVTIPSSNSITIENVITPGTATISIAAANPLYSLANYFTATITHGGANPIYQWKKNGQDLVGENNNSYLAFSLNVGDVISCELTSDEQCASPNMASSNTLAVTTLSYCIPQSQNNYQPCQYYYISNVTLGNTVNNSTGCDGFYSDFTASQTLNSAAGQTVNFSLTEGSIDGQNWGSSISVFIDYNNDGDFNDDGETVANNLDFSFSSATTGSFTIPAMLAPGSYRIRVFNTNLVTNACDLDFGEAEDYTLLIPQPAYCIPVISQPCDMWISNVTIGSINNNSTQPVVCTEGGYTDYSSLLSTTAGPGQTVDFSLSGGSLLYWGSWQFADIFIDFNNDGDFDDDGERVVQNFAFYSGYPYTGSFTIPADQPYGYYRMRAKSYNYDSNIDIYSGPCGNNMNGEVEDYRLIVDCVPNGSDIVVQGNNVDIADGDNTPDPVDFTDFGNVELGSGFIRTFTIKNSGINTLNLGIVTMAGGNNNNYFSIASQPLVNVLNAGESTTFTVQFDSPVWGYGFNFNTTVHVASDNCDKKDYDFAIKATASCPAGGPDINIQGNGIDIAGFDFSPDPADNTDFGTVTANNTLNKTFVIQNTGISDLNISGIQLFNYDNLLQFAVTTQPASIIAPGSSTSFTISFNPVASGSRYAYVRVESNDCDESYYDFKIIGEAECSALTPEINVKGNNIDIVDGDNTPSDADNTDFGLAALNTSVSKTFVIENTGADPMNILGVTFTGTGAADFSVTTAPASTVAAGSSTLFTVQFLSTVSGLKSATMHINNSDCDEGDYDIEIRGTDGTVCTPVISIPCYYMYINNVTIGSINNNSVCSYGSGYSDYSGTLSDIEAPGATVQFSASASGNEQKVNVYIDYNKDGDFEDAGELVLSDLYMYPNTINATGSFVVPQTLAPGNYRIRVISQFYYQNSLTPCYTYYGEAEDYTLTIQSTSFASLYLKLFLEGSYRGNSTMEATLYNLELSTDPTATDNISVNLWNPSHTDINNYPEPDYTSATILHTDGTATLQFPSAVLDQAFYIAVKHRNSIETWSKLPVMFTSNTIYDFSTGLNKAYDDNVIAPMKMMEENVYGFYAGDINQDGAIDGQDMNVIDNEVGFFGYNVSDVNGDGATDGQDMNFVDNNSQLGLFFARPY